MYAWFLCKMSEFKYMSLGKELLQICFISKVERWTSNLANKITSAFLWHCRCAIFLESISFQVMAWSWIKCWRGNSNELNSFKDLKYWTKKFYSSLCSFLIYLLSNRKEEVGGVGRKGPRAFLSQNTQRKKWFLLQSFTALVISQEQFIVQEWTSRESWWIKVHVCDSACFGKVRKSHFCHM